MKQLRDYGMYNLPGSLRALYLVPNGEDTYFLYDGEFGSRLPPRFRVTGDGHIINWFDDFPVWTIADLTDTGETYETPVFSSAINLSVAENDLVSIETKK
jgi:hypothetical protein